MGMLVDDFRIERVPLTRHHYRISLRLGEHTFGRQTDDNLGHLMTLLSDLWKSIALTAGLPVSSPQTPLLTSPIRFTELSVRPSLVVHERWTLKIVSGPYRYVAGMDAELEHVLLACQGAMTFLGAKYGHLVVEPEVIRTREQAEQLAGMGNGSRRPRR